MKAFSLKIIFFSLLLAFSIKSTSQQTAKNLTGSNGVFIGFYEYKPADYNSSKKYPLIIFLHGVSERGNGTTELSRVTVNGIPKYIKNGNKMTFNWNGKVETFLVLSPQLSSAYGSWPSFYAEEMIKYARQNLSIDTNRIIVTGISLGGGGTWRYAGQNSENPKRIAALAPVCGTQQSLDFCNIARANLPVWAFHATGDGMVSVNSTINQVNAIKNCNPNVNPLSTIWPTGGHVIWDRAYDTTYLWQNPNIFEWFLAQNKSLPVNSLPISNAGSDKSVNVGESFKLDGTLSKDADGKIVRYIWRQIGGPSTCLLDSAINSNGVSYVTPVNTSGVYQFELKIADDRAATSTDTLKISVISNKSPIANAGKDTSYLTGQTVTLNGSLSFDDHKIISQSWELIEGPFNVNIQNSDSIISNFIPPTTGNYIFKLTVKDSAGLTGEDQIIINVASVLKNPPVAKAGNDTTINTSTFHLNGSNSYDDNGITSIRWSQVSGPSNAVISSTSNIQTNVSQMIPGIYTFRLRVWDKEKNLSYDDIVLKVNDIISYNQLPYVSAGNDKTILFPENSSQLIGSANDNDGTIISYNWIQISGPSLIEFDSPSQSTTNISNLNPGIYVIRLKVTDNKYDSSFDDVAINVKEKSDPPVANAGNDLIINTTTFNLDGAGSYDDKSISSKTWTQLSGPSTSKIADYRSFKTNVSNLIPGIYRFRIRVWDEEGQIDTDDVYVTVK